MISHAGEVGYSTNGYMVVDWLISENRVMDKVMLFNLTGYGTSPVSMNRHDVFSIAGWSDKVFDILAALENGGNAIDMIRRIVV